MTEKTANTDVYEQRHAAALAAISEAIAAHDADDGKAELETRLDALSREKADLQAELEGLRDQRSKDMAELDELISQLKPLIGDV